MRTMIEALSGGRALAEGAGTFGSALSDASRAFMQAIMDSAKKDAQAVGATLKLEASEIWWWIAIKKGGKDMGAMAIIPSERDVHGMCTLVFDPRDSGGKASEREVDAESTVATFWMHLRDYLNRME
jgi:hypothetical protein